MGQCGAACDQMLTHIGMPLAEASNDSAATSAKPLRSARRRSSGMMKYSIVALQWRDVHGGHSSSAATPGVDCNDETMRKCIDECRRCAESCREMAAEAEGSRLGHGVTERRAECSPLRPPVASSLMFN